MWQPLTLMVLLVFRGQQKIANVVLFIALLKKLYSYSLITFCQKENILFFLMMVCTVHMLALTTKTCLSIIPLDIGHIYQNYHFP